MADEKKPEDDEIEVVEVETLPKPGETPAAEIAEDDAPEGEEEDARLADTEDEEEGDAPPDEDPAAKKKRLSRRQARNKARDRNLAELDRLRAFERDTIARFARLEDNQLSQSEAQIDSRLAEVRNDISTADRILAAAIGAGNGEDAATALRLRDEAKAAESELIRQKGGVTDSRKNAPDPVVTAFANEWKAANVGWYGVDQNATSVANRIDAQLKAEGHPPNRQSYWSELSRRVQAEFKPPADTNGVTPPKRRAPPQGQTREHVPASTRSGEVYVTPERKAALQEMGVWDDKSSRDRYLKAYAKYDREEAERVR